MIKPTTPLLKAPFPAMGGKSRAAHLVWSALGDPRNYIEPFCLSAANLLSRPHRGAVETLNDVNVYVSNFWRAVRHDPYAVAVHADDPISEPDLHARHRWLLGIEQAPPQVPAEYEHDPMLVEAFLSGARWPSGSYAGEFRRRILTDPHYFDAKFAGWWCWGACMWIGSGWCNYADDDAGWREGRTASGDVEQRRPTVSDSQTGVTNKLPHDKRPHMGDGNSGDGSKGVNANPVLWSGLGSALQWSQKGVMRRGGDCGVAETFGLTSGGRPQLADAYARGRGVHGRDAAETCRARHDWLIDWFCRLADRLRPVRVCCGDWARVCSSPSVTTRIGMTGVFLDPPYAVHIDRMHAWAAHMADPHNVPSPDGKRPGAKGRSRDKFIYGSDAGDVDHLVARVHRYCIERGDDAKMRIVLAGLEGEHNALEQIGWRKVAWKAHGGYGNRNPNNGNKHRERLWLSPHCQEIE